MNNLLILWIASLVIFVVVEAATVQLVTIWFAFGSLGALISNLCGAPVWLQWVIFTSLSFISLVISRPFIKKVLNKKIEPTNADRFIGMEGIVIENINNTLGKGQVRVKGTTWTARSKHGIEIDVGEPVVVDEIEGVKLMVSSKK
ncbi:MAG: NfeD family protein [Clostridiales bacterium]|jgi:membrane protein implicated in regulation of membrane protease activity|nr:NfeD family protein [Clostridiales bacterium]